VKGKPDIIDIIEKRRLHWYGYFRRMPEERRKTDVQEKRGWKVYKQP
jgi:hypothetical protein